MSDDWKVQASYKFNGTDMLNVRGDDAADLKKQLDELSGDALESITATGVLLNAVQNLTTGGLTTPPVTPPQQQQVAEPQSTAPQHVSPLDAYRSGGAVQPAAATTAPAPGPAAGSVWPACVHGTKGAITKTGARGRWYAYACPADKRSDPTACDLAFENKMPDDHKAVARNLDR